MAEHKSEKPTPRRLQKARQEGKFPSSRDLVASVQLTVALAVAVSMGKDVLVPMRQAMSSLLDVAFTSHELAAGDLVALFRGILLPCLAALMEKAALVMGIVLLLHLITTGFGFSTKQLLPDLSRLNFGSRIKQLPKQNLSNTLKAIALLPIIALVLYEEIYPRLPDLANLTVVELGLGISEVRGMIESLLWRLTSALLVIGVIDFVRQRRSFQNELRMTKQDMKDETKEAEGNPQMKMRIRRLQRDATRRNMMKAVPKASVVITNPTHYAIAIRYEMNSKSVPTVVAKGKNYLAQLIRERAVQHEIPVIENKPLAQALYQAVDVGQEIPSHLYRAVAEVLAYIYRTLNRR